MAELIRCLGNIYNNSFVVIMINLRSSSGTLEPSWAVMIIINVVLYFSLRDHYCVHALHCSGFHRGSDPSISMWVWYTNCTCIIIIFWYMYNQCMLISLLHQYMMHSRWVFHNDHSWTLCSWVSSSQAEGGCGWGAGGNTHRSLLSSWVQFGLPQWRCVHITIWNSV